MSKKYAQRSMPVITRQSYDVERAPAPPNWMDEFANNLAKQSTQSKQKAHHNIYDQISSIMGNRSKYPTVEAAVEDMKERSGMKDFLNKLQSQGQNEDGATKRAQDSSCGMMHDHNDVKMFKQVPQLKETIDNYCEDTNGNLALPAIVEKIKSIHKGDVTDDSAWDDAGFLHYINDKNVEVKKRHPADTAAYRNLGRVPPHTHDQDIDPSNTDALHALNPVVIGK